MVHRMCAACRIRSQSLRPADDVLPEPCPGCGAPLEPVDRPSSILGFRWMAPDPGIDLDFDDVVGGLSAGAIALPVPGTGGGGETVAVSQPPRARMTDRPRPRRQ
jgi:hypothetical protein